MRILGLRAGITIAATYPAAVIGMAVLRAWKGSSILEENIARTAGSIGESVAAGAIFTIPAFLIREGVAVVSSRRRLLEIDRADDGGQHSGRVVCFAGAAGDGGRSGIAFPESVAASEIHKAGQRGAKAAKYLFWNIGIGGVVYLLGRFGLFASDKDFHFPSALWAQPGAAGHSGEREYTGGRRAAVRRAQRESGLSGRGLHHRIATGVDSICRRGAGLGIDGSPAHLLSGAEAAEIICLPIRPMTGPRWRRRCGDSLCGPSPWVECWWARLTRCSKCAPA